MCRVEFGDYPEVFSHDTPRARRAWRCLECQRVIPVGERYHLFTGRWDGAWDKHRWCAHCYEAAQWLNEMCNGYVFGEVLDELLEHWHEDENYRSIPFARMIVNMRRGWHNGRDPLPTGAAEMARAMMTSAVA